MPTGTASSHDDEEGAGKPPKVEKDRPLLGELQKKKGKSGISFSP